jgi:hypothetical protein
LSNALNDSTDTSQISLTFNALAPFPIEINVRPASDKNLMNPTSHGKIRDAVLTTESFNAVRDLDYGTVTFGAGDADPVRKKRKMQ